MNIIIDGNNLAFRSTFVPHTPISYQGKNIAAAQQMIRMIRLYIERFQPRNVYVVWDRRLNQDADTRIDIRKNLQEQYKMTRNRSSYEAVFDSIVIAEPLFTALGVKQIYPYDLEGDDVIAWLATQPCKGQKTTIISKDSDLWQLITETTHCYVPQKDIVYDLATFAAKEKLTPFSYVVYKSLVGDPVDNIRGIEGVGPVKGRKLAGRVMVAADPSNVLTAEQCAIYYDNLKMVDLEYAIKQHPTEKVHYATQLDAQKDLIPDFNQFKTLCAQYGFSALLQSHALTTLKAAFGAVSEQQTLAAMFEL